MLILSQHGRTFATRERAREIVALLDGEPGDVVRVNASNVSASPSFVAELLSRLTERFREVRVEGASDHLEELASDIAGKLHLEGVYFAALA